MKHRQRSASFSLIELTLAIGIASFCLIAVFGLLPVGLKTNQDSTSQTGAASILTAVIADMRSTPKTTATSLQFAITFGTEKTLYFDSQMTPSSAIGANSRYRLTVTFPTNPSGTGSTTFSDLRVSWPAPALPANAAGSCEMFAAFDRH